MSSYGLNSNPLTKPGGGGSGASLTPPTLQSGVVLLAANESGSLRVTNPHATNPTVVSLSDSEGYVDWDSSVIGVGGGTFKDASFSRSASMPLSGGPFPTTVQALLGDGSQISQGLSLEVRATIRTLVQSWSPTHLWVFTDDGSGNVEDLGSSPVNAVPSVLTFESSSRTGWDGESNCSGSGFFQSTIARLGAGGCSYDRDRSWGLIWVPQGNGTTRNLIGSTAVWRMRQVGADSSYVAYYKGGSNTTLDTSYSHTTLANSESLLNTASRPCLLIHVYDAALQEWTIRWKQLTHNASGHSFRTIGSIAPDATAGNINWKVFGWNVNDAGHAFGGGFFMLDDKVTAAQFDQLAGAIGLNAA